MSRAPGPRPALADATTGVGALRREAPIVLPLSLLLFAALACVTLFSYRAAVDRLEEERSDFARRYAAALAEVASSSGPDDAGAAVGGLAPGISIAFYDSRGERLVSVPGGFAAPPRAPAAALALAAPMAEGPSADDTMRAWAPFSLRRRASGDGGADSATTTRRRLLLLAVPEPTLAAERRRLRILTPVVFLLTAALSAVAISFLWALNRPYAALLERARELPASTADRAGPAGTVARIQKGDELDFLLATFDRALAALRASDDEPAGSGRSEAEARLAASVAELGTLAAGVAHELRNSLGTIRGYLALLDRRELPGEAREEVAGARAETEALARVADDFLVYASATPREPAKIDLAALLAKAASDPSLGTGAVAFAPPVETILLVGDESLLRRALRNLLLNAVEASRRTHSAVPVELAMSRTPAGEALVTIRDHGPGISPEIAEVLFTPFRSDRPGGVGLGLALARRIARLHGGELRLENRGGDGAEARLSLPLAKA